jgi:hypothetical protein
MKFRDIVSDVMGWIELAENREDWSALVNKVINLRVS